MTLRFAFVALCLSLVYVSACAQPLAGTGKTPRSDGGGNGATTGGDGGNSSDGGATGDGPIDNGGNGKDGGASTGNGDGGALSCGTRLDQTGCDCAAVGLTRACYTGPAATENVGVCQDGVQTCLSAGEFTTWGPCDDEVKPGAEMCSDTLDHNCDGRTGCDDPACAFMAGCCTPSTTRPCYDGLPATANVGQCTAGTQTCNAQGGWDACGGEVLPGNESGSCSDGIDNDCNGFADCHDLACKSDPACAPKACQTGATQPCYDGAASSINVGVCRAGTQTCDATGQWPATCAGEILPGSESGNCQDDVDNDCNGFADCHDLACASDAACQAKACQPGAMQPCYTGPSGTSGIGICAPGSQTCDATGKWPTTCAAEVLPGGEAGNCHDGFDNDCNGKLDCQDPACAADPACAPKACQPFATQPCYDGPANTVGRGPCHAGTQTCTTQGQWGSCSGEVLPGSELFKCHDSVDNDCNGDTDCDDLLCILDSGCQPAECTSGQTQPCYDGPSSTAGNGPCRAGTQSCNAQGQWSSTCSGEVLPGSESGRCGDNVDNDCDGLTDCQDGACASAPACAPALCQAFSTQGCYDGDPATEGVGACQDGTQTCASDGSAWGSCQGETLPGDESNGCSDGVDNDCNGLTDCDDFACTGSSDCCVPNPSIDGTIYATGRYTLYTVDPHTWGLTTVGSFGVTEQMTDIALTPDGDLYTLSADALYWIDRTTGEATYWMDVPGAQNNGMTFLPDGTLLAADASGELKSIDPLAGTVTDIGNYGNGYTSSGDLVAVADGTMYGISATGYGGYDATDDNILLTIDTSTGEATEIGDIGFGNVFGLAYYNGRVIALTDAGQVVEIDPSNGAGMLLSTNNTNFFGGTSSPLMPGMGCQ